MSESGSSKFSTAERVSENSGIRCVLAAIQSVLLCPTLKFTLSAQDTSRLIQGGGDCCAGARVHEDTKVRRAIRQPIPAMNRRGLSLAALGVPKLL
jgi:hypothetical protein